MKIENKVLRYVIGGFLIGLLFPFTSVLICYFLLTTNHPFSLSLFHLKFPLLAVIDLAPIVLALVAYFVGTNINNATLKLVEEVNEMNEKLFQQNREKELLLKEIHHRVKNNLQVITSLLSLQGSFQKDEIQSDLFKKSTYRINSMAIIHEMLYQSKDIAKINYRDYIQSLVNGLVMSMKGENNRVTVNIDVPEMYLNLDTAVPLGLIINEIVTNSLKHGVREDSSGAISVRMKKEAAKEFVLFIGDDGVGMPENLNYQNSNSLGLLLINKLALQLQGSVSMDLTRKGTNYMIHFQQIDQGSI
jgi:two-component system, sensor histidine kinase PdtaS